jgi:beta-lactamase superfamily II metal-dependent hydrolase
MYAYYTLYLWKKVQFLSLRYGLFSRSQKNFIISLGFLYQDFILCRYSYHMSMKNVSKPLFMAAAATAVAGSFGAYLWKAESRPPILEIYVFNLSGGRSIFIRTPEDKRYLVDGGFNSQVIREITGILPFYSRRIDGVIATDTEGRDISGLIDIIERYDVSDAYIPGITLEVLGIASSSDHIFSTFTETLRRKGVRTHESIAGDHIRLDNKTDLKVLFPVHQDRFAYSKASSPEILFDISMGGTSVTFLGDASNRVQKFIASTSPLMDKTDVLVISHSALPANTSPILMGKLHPDYLVYSKLIRNTSARSGMSSSSKKKAIEDSLARVGDMNRFNLKEEGTIKITSNGRQIHIVGRSAE